MIHKNILKSYAPDARSEFIRVITERAAFYGITENKIFPCEIKGDFAFISGRPFPKGIDKSRNDLIALVEKTGFVQTMEEIAYTWFNRFVAIRFMEVNGYLSHGYRVLSHPEGHNEPEILEKAQFIEKLDGLEKCEIIKLKTATGKESELYRRLIIAQCNDLSDAMPFLFERVDDPSELLLPDNLLNTDSVIRKIVSSIPEEDWKEVEIVGWLYQFYISEKKDQLMKAKKAYKTEEIPAVTQLFTPNWIVKYLVQNSLGAKWLATYPKSALKERMEYYIPPAEQSEEVQTKIKEITPESLNPEELTIMDPACGSGHILVEAYNILKEIYLERGYRAREIAVLILTKNLFGLEIDERAAQLAGFALMMKAYADDRDILTKGIKPNIVCLNGAQRGAGSVIEAKELVELFEKAKTFGSLIRVPSELILKLPDLKQLIKSKRNDLNSHFLGEGTDFYDYLLTLVHQAEILSNNYDCVIANPPYMGGKGMNETLKEFAKTQYPLTKSDLCTMFIERGFEMAKEKIGYNAMITMQGWMFLLSYEKCREIWIETKTIQSMAHLGSRAFSTISGEVVTVTAFCFMNGHRDHYRPSFLRLIDGDEEDKRLGIITKKNKFSQTIQDNFKQIPGSPIAYWVSNKIRNIFTGNPCMSSEFTPKSGLTSGDKPRFIRMWSEVSFEKINFSAKNGISNRNKWFPHNDGGNARKWYGNQESVIDWENDGQNIKGFKGSTIRNPDYYFRAGITWNDMSTLLFCARYLDEGFVFENTGSMLFSKNHEDYNVLLAYLSSKIIFYFMNLLNPTLHFGVGEIARLPILKINANKKDITYISSKNIEIGKEDWNSREIAWDYKQSPLLKKTIKSINLRFSYNNFFAKCRKMTDEMKQLEEANNRLFIEAYNLQDEFTAEVLSAEIILFANPKFRYKGELTDNQLERHFKSDTMKEFISYAIGCMMGRYSLDVQGLVYAHVGNNGFDPTKFKTFPADEDGIIPISEQEWFDDDAASRLFRFVEIVWDKKGLEENLDFIAEAIGRKPGEPSRKTIRTYFVNDFFKDHCRTYKNRPIYWLFTSGKEKAFQALVYLHRYNEGTLARMRTEYVLPLQTKIMRHIEHLEKDKESASGSLANKIQKEIVALQKQRAELLMFEERLRNFADKRIKIDLDDGVKVNYGKFGELLKPLKGLNNGSEED